MFDVRIARVSPKLCKLGKQLPSCITLFISIIVFCGTDSIMQNILHIRIEYGEYSA